MLKFMKQIFVSTLMFFGSLSSVNPLEYVSMKNQKWKVRPKNVNVNSNEPIFYPLVLKQINAVVLLMVLMTLMQNYAFLMWLKFKCHSF